MDGKRSYGAFLLGFGISVLVAVWWWQQRLAEPEVSSMLPPVRPSNAPAGPRKSDPLEEIHGIGAVYARRLRAAGVHSFADLAALDPEEVRAKIGAQPWQADTATWIAQAQERAQVQ